MEVVELYFKVALGVVLPVEKVILLNGSPYLTVVQEVDDVDFVGE